MIEFKCSSCGLTLNVSDEKAGKKGRCPQCGAVMIIPPADLLSMSEADHPTDRTGSVSGHSSASSDSFDGIGGSLLTGAIEKDRDHRDGHERRCKLCRTIIQSGVTVCPNCGALLQDAGARPDSPTSGVQSCPSCGDSLPGEAMICVRCGIRIRSGRPIVTARDMDPDEMETRAENVIRPISWLIPFGLYPFFSEAMGKSKPIATWAIVIVTVIASAWFWAYEWSGSTEMRSLKNLMLWSGDAKPDSDWIIAFYNQTNYGDAEAFVAKREELAGTVPDDELDVRTYEALTGEQQCLGRYRFSQLITHAFLHGGLLHLAGNMLFLLVFGSRVNAVVGNIATVVLYFLLAIAAGLAHLSAAAAEMPMPMLGASGAIMGMAGMYLMLFPIHKVHMVIWMRWGLIAGFRLSSKIFALWGVLVVLSYIAFDVFYTALGAETTVAHWAHLGGFIAGFCLAAVLLMGRLVYSGSDVLSLVLGKYAWPLIGTPASHAGRKSWLAGIGRRM